MAFEVFDYHLSGLLGMLSSRDKMVMIEMAVAQSQSYLHTVNATYQIYNSPSGFESLSKTDIDQLTGKSLVQMVNAIVLVLQLPDAPKSMVSRALDALGAAIKYCSQWTGDVLAIRLSLLIMVRSCLNIQYNSQAQEEVDLSICLLDTLESLLKHQEFWFIPTTTLVHFTRYIITCCIDGSISLTARQKSISLLNEIIESHLPEAISSEIAAANSDYSKLRKLQSSLSSNDVLSKTPSSPRSDSKVMLPPVELFDPQVLEPVGVKFAKESVAIEILECLCDIFGPLSLDPTLYVDARVNNPTNLVDEANLSILTPYQLEYIENMTIRRCSPILPPGAISALCTPISVVEPISTHLRLDVPAHGSSSFPAVQVQWPDSRSDPNNKLVNTQIPPYFKHIPTSVETSTPPSLSRSSSVPSTPPAAGASLHVHPTSKSSGSSTSTGIEGLLFMNFQNCGVSRDLLEINLSPIEDSPATVAGAGVPALDSVKGLGLRELDERAPLSNSPSRTNSIPSLPLPEADKGSAHASSPGLNTPTKSSHHNMYNRFVAQLSNSLLLPSGGANSSFGANATVSSGSTHPSTRLVAVGGEVALRSLKTSLAILIPPDLFSTFIQNPNVSNELLRRSFLGVLSSRSVALPGAFPISVESASEIGMKGTSSQPLSSSSEFHRVPPTLGHRRLTSLSDGTVVFALQSLHTLSEVIFRPGRAKCHIRALSLSHFYRRVIDIMQRRALLGVTWVSDGSGIDMSFNKPPEDGVLPPQPSFLSALFSGRSTSKPNVSMGSSNSNQSGGTSDAAISLQLAPLHLQRLALRVAQSLLASPVSSALLRAPLSLLLCRVLIRTLTAPSRLAVAASVFIGALPVRTALSHAAASLRAKEEALTRSFVSQSNSNFNPSSFSTSNSVSLLSGSMDLPVLVQHVGGALETHRVPPRLYLGHLLPSVNAPTPLLRTSAPIVDTRQRVYVSAAEAASTGPVLPSSTPSDAAFPTPQQLDQIVDEVLKHVNKQPAIVNRDALGVLLASFHPSSPLLRAAELALDTCAALVNLNQGYTIGALFMHNDCTDGQEELVKALLHSLAAAAAGVASFHSVLGLLPGSQGALLQLPIPSRLKQTALSVIDCINGGTSAAIKRAQGSSRSTGGVSEEVLQNLAQMRSVRSKRQTLQACAKAFNAKPQRGVEALRSSGLLVVTHISSDSFSAAPETLNRSLEDLGDNLGPSTFSQKLSSTLSVGSPGRNHSSLLERLHPSWEPHSVPYILRSQARCGFDPRAVGEYLGSGTTADDESKRRQFCQLLAPQLSELPLVSALRVFLSTFHLPGEAQQIDRILQTFAGVAHLASPDSSKLPSIDAAFLLTFSLILLNTDLHNPSLKAERRMTEAAFVRQNEYYGDDICHGRRMDVDALKAMYANIKRASFAPPPAAFTQLPLHSVPVADASSIHSLSVAPDESVVAAAAAIGSNGPPMSEILWKLNTSADVDKRLRSFFSPSLAVFSSESISDAVLASAVLIDPVDSNDLATCPLSSTETFEVPEFEHFEAPEQMTASLLLLLAESTHPTLRLLLSLLKSSTEPATLGPLALRPDITAIRLRPGAGAVRYALLNSPPKDWAFTGKFGPSTRLWGVGFPPGSNPMVDAPPLALQTTHSAQDALLRELEWRTTVCARAHVLSLQSLTEATLAAGCASLRDSAVELLCAAAASSLTHCYSLTGSSSSSNSSVVVLPANAVLTTFSADLGAQFSLCIAWDLLASSILPSDLKPFYISDVTQRDRHSFPLKMKLSKLRPKLLTTGSEEKSDFSVNPRQLTRTSISSYVWVFDLLLRSLRCGALPAASVHPFSFVNVHPVDSVATGDSSSASGLSGEEGRHHACLASVFESELGQLPSNQAASLFSVLGSHQMRVDCSAALPGLRESLLESSEALSVPLAARKQASMGAGAHGNISTSKARDVGAAEAETSESFVYSTGDTGLEAEMSTSGAVTMEESHMTGTESEHTKNSVNSEVVPLFEGAAPLAGSFVGNLAATGLNALLGVFFNAEQAFSAQDSSRGVTENGSINPPAGEGSGSTVTLLEGPSTVPAASGVVGAPASPATLTGEHKDSDAVQVLLAGARKPLDFVLPHQNIDIVEEPESPFLLSLDLFPSQQGTSNGIGPNTLERPKSPLLPSARRLIVSIANSAFPLPSNSKNTIHVSRFNELLAAVSALDQLETLEKHQILQLIRLARYTLDTVTADTLALQAEELNENTPSASADHSHNTPTISGTEGLTGIVRSLFDDGAGVLHGAIHPTAVPLVPPFSQLNSVCGVLRAALCAAATDACVSLGLLNHEKALMAVLSVDSVIIDNLLGSLSSMEFVSVDERIVQVAPLLHAHHMRQDLTSRKLSKHLEHCFMMILSTFTNVFTTSDFLKDEILSYFLETLAAHTVDLLRFSVGLPAEFALAVQPIAAQFLAMAQTPVLFRNTNDNEKTNILALLHAIRGPELRSLLREFAKSPLSGQRLVDFVMQDVITPATVSAFLFHSGSPVAGSSTVSHTRTRRTSSSSSSSSLVSAPAATNDIASSITGVPLSPGSSTAPSSASVASAGLVKAVLDHGSNEKDWDGDIDRDKKALLYHSDPYIASHSLQFVHPSSQTSSATHPLFSNPYYRQLRTDIENFAFVDITDLQFLSHYGIATSPLTPILSVQMASTAVICSSFKTVINSFVSDTELNVHTAEGNLFKECIEFAEQLIAADTGVLLPNVPSFASQGLDLLFFIAKTAMNQYLFPPSISSNEGVSHLHVLGLVSALLSHLTFDPRAHVRLRALSHMKDLIALIPTSILSLKNRENPLEHQCPSEQRVALLSARTVRMYLTHLLPSALALVVQAVRPLSLVAVEKALESLAVLTCSCNGSFAPLDVASLEVIFASAGGETESVHAAHTAMYAAAFSTQPQISEAELKQESDLISMNSGWKDLSYNERMRAIFASVAPNVAEAISKLSVSLPQHSPEPFLWHYPHSEDEETYFGNSATKSPAENLDALNYSILCEKSLCLATETLSKGFLALLPLLLSNEVEPIPDSIEINAYSASAPDLFLPLSKFILSFLEMSLSCIEHSIPERTAAVSIIRNSVISVLVVLQADLDTLKEKDDLKAETLWNGVLETIVQCKSVELLCNSTPT